MDRRVSDKEITVALGRRVCNSKSLVLNPIIRQRQLKFCPDQMFNDRAGHHDAGTFSLAGKRRLNQICNDTAQRSGMVNTHSKRLGRKELKRSLNPPGFQCLKVKQLPVGEVVQKVNVGPHLVNASPAGAAALFRKDPRDAMFIQNCLNCVPAQPRDLTALRSQKVFCGKRRRAFFGLPGENKHNA